MRQVLKASKAAVKKASKGYVVSWHDKPQLAHKKQE